MGSHTIKEHLASYKQRTTITYITLDKHNVCTHMYIYMHACESKCVLVVVVDMDVDCGWRALLYGIASTITAELSREEHTATQHNCVCVCTYVVVGKKVDWMGAPQA